MKNVVKYLLAFIIILSYSCNKDDNRIAKEPELVWSSPLKGDTLVLTMKPVIYQNIVLHSQVVLGNDYTPIVAYDKNTGEKLWSWHDYFIVGEVFYGSNHKMILYENYLTFSTNGKNVYTIDLSTGQTVWRTPNDGLGGNRNISSLENLIFHVTLLPGRSEYHLNIVDIHTGNWQTIYTTQAEADYLPDLTVPSYYINEIGDTLLLFLNNRYSFDVQKGHPELICYNLTKSEVVYEKEITSPTNGYGVVREPLVYNDNVYFHVGPYVYCYDIMTGERRWSKLLEDIVGSISFILEDDRLFVGIEGLDPKLYAIEPNTGMQLWKIESSGTSSMMDYYDGVIYFNGGGNGLLHAVNAQTGEYIWQYTSPDLEEHSGAWFDSFITIDKETGRIHTANFLNALCFEAM